MDSAVRLQFFENQLKPRLQTEPPKALMPSGGAQSIMRACHRRVVRIDRGGAAAAFSARY
jgi:hypothetical protein